MEKIHAKGPKTVSEEELLCNRTNPNEDQCMTNRQKWKEIFLCNRTNPGVVLDFDPRSSGSQNRMPAVHEVFLGLQNKSTTSKQH